MDLYVIQKDAETKEWLRHKEWTTEQDLAAKMNEASAKRCLEKLKAKAIGLNAIIVRVSGDRETPA